MRTDGLLRTGKDTAVCNMVLDNTGTLVGGVADMSIMESVTGKQVNATFSLLAEALDHFYLQIIEQLRLPEHTPSIVALDGNLLTRNH